MFVWKVLFMIAIMGYAMAQRSSVAVMRSTTNANSDISGTVHFTETGSGEVLVEVSLSGLSVSAEQLGIHLHNWGDISDASGSAAGPHWIGSGSSSHGCPPSSNRHEGDLGSWTVSNGRIDQSKTLDLVTLSGSTSVVGRGVILHDIADPCDDTSTGARIAMGVIGISNEDSNQARQGENPEHLICHLQGTSNCPDCSGTVWFQDEGSFITVTAQLSGLSQGSVHGIHIHEFGDITDEQLGTSLGSHYNPDDSDHGLPFTSNRHEGDMGNVQSYDTDNTAWYRLENSQISSTGSIAGRGIVVHEGADNGNGFACGSSGNSGSRYAICVIGVASDDITVPSPPIFVDNSFEANDCEDPNVTNDDDDATVPNDDGDDETVSNSDDDNNSDDDDDNDDDYFVDDDFSSASCIQILSFSLLVVVAML